MSNKILSACSEVISTLKMTPTQALIWLTCWSCWTLGSLQYYALPFVLTNVSTDLGVAQTNVSEANTTTMLARALGALIFGVLSDKYGRKGPLIVDLIFMCGFTVATGFSRSFGELIGFRLLFGVAYGGIYGLVMATVLESVPEKARGVVAGFTQQGFSAGYLFASGLHLGMNKYGWRSLFWLCGGLSLPIALLRLITPNRPITAESPTDNISFLQQISLVVKHHPKPFIYACCLTSCLATMGHGTMDLYPTFLVSQRHLDITHETYVTVILQIGGIIGGVVGGFLSHKFSPKWIACIAGLLCAPWLPLWVLPSHWGLLALGAFFIQFFYGAAIGNLGNLLQQLCPNGGMRAVFTGVAYNIGNAVSSIAPTVETALGGRFPLPDGGADYGKTQMIVVGIVIFCLTVTLLLMPQDSLNENWDGHENVREEVVEKGESEHVENA